jgi:hypothetical protein
VRYRFEVPPKGLKKKILWGGTFEVDEDGMNAVLEIGTGFDVMAFLDSFYERAYYLARLHVTHVEW